jgi:hypothetical protein
LCVFITFALTLESSDIVCNVNDCCEISEQRHCVSRERMLRGFVAATLCVT